MPLIIRILIKSGIAPGSTERELDSLRGMLEHDVSAWELLLFSFLGTDSAVGWLLVALTFAMLAYNVLRVLLTTRVAYLRRNGAPQKDKVHVMYRIHMPWMYVLFALSLCYFALRVYDSANFRALAAE